MKNRFLSLLLACAAVMLLLPWLTVTFIRSDAGMAVCFLLFFAVNPVFSVYTGVLSGRNLRIMWPVPLLNAALFVTGTWLVFEPGEMAFITYGCVYLLLGTAAMLLTAALKKK